MQCRCLLGLDGKGLPLGLQDHRQGHWTKQSVFNAGLAIEERADLFAKPEQWWLNLRTVLLACLFISMGVCLYSTRPWESWLG